MYLINKDETEHTGQVNHYAHAVIDSISLFAVFIKMWHVCSNPKIDHTCVYCKDPIEKGEKRDILGRWLGKSDLI